MWISFKSICPIVSHQHVQGADLVGHHTWEHLQGSEPLLVRCNSIGSEEDVVQACVSSMNLSVPVREGLAEAGASFKTLALGATELGGSTSRDACYGGGGLYRKTGTDCVDGQLAHSSLTGPDSCDGVHSAPELNSADEVGPVHGDEL